MSDKKNIERLFQEKFKDFEFQPDEQVWKNIEAALREKKDRKIIPIWFRLAGIAAALMLGFFTWNSIFNNDQNWKNRIVIDNTNKHIKNPNENNPIVNQSKPSKTETDIDIDIRTKENANPGKNKSYINKTPKDKISRKNHLTSKPEGAIVSTRSDVIQKKKIQKPSKTKSEINSSIAGESDLKRNKIKKQKVSNLIKNNDAVAKAQNNNKLKRVLPEYTIKSKTDYQEMNSSAALVNQEKNTTNDVIKYNSAENPLTAKNNIVLSEKPVEEKKLDSTAIATVVPNALEELLKKNEKEKKIAETNLNRWQITTNVAPIYFSSTSGGSPIDQQFSGNNKTYDNNMSFGVGVNYAVNKKLSIRAGVNKFTLGYKTNDIVFFEGIQSRTSKNPNISHNSNNIVIANRGGEFASLFPSENEDGLISQKMGYIEIPMEISYKIIGKKFGITVIGGLSTLFLNENTITVVSPAMSERLGEANNLNDIHFSSNIGLGFKYNFWKSFEINFEPMFKYQINTFSKDSGNFKPYFIGLYSGLSFNF